MRAPALLVVLGLVVYANGLAAPFVFDDLHAVVENPHVWHLVPLSEAIKAPPQSALSGRPLVSLSLAANVALGGRSPAALRAGNLCIHIVAALLLFAIVRRQLEERFALLVAALWLVHPLQTETVDYITQRTESLMALFYLATLYAAIRGRTLIAIGVCAAGMASKESMVTAPLMVLAYDVIFNGQPTTRALARRPVLYAGLAASWIVLIALNAQGPRSNTAGFSTGVSPLQYLLAQGPMIATYLKLSVWPRPLVLDYGPMRPVAIADVWPGVALVATLIVAAGLAWRVNRKIAFLGLWFIVTLAPASSIVPIASELGAERRMYLPLAALVTGIVVLIRQSSSWRRALGMPAAVVAVACLAMITIRRNAEFHDPIALWQGVVEQRPHGRARHALGFALQQAGRREEAIAQYRLAAPDYPLARYNLALQLAASGAIDEAIGELQLRLRQAPSDTDSRGALADLLLRHGRYVDAAAEYAAYLKLVPDSAAAHNNYGLALVHQHRVADAVREFRIALALAPSDTGASRNLARALTLLTAPGTI